MPEVPKPTDSPDPSAGPVPQHAPRGLWATGFPPGSLPVAVISGIAAGAAGALFLWSLDAVTRWRWASPGWLLVLPAAGVAMRMAYRAWGRGSDRGTGLVLEAVRDPRVEVPWVLAPMVLAATLLSHLCGAPVGREGTAVQMGASLGAAIRRRFLPGTGDPSVALLAGMAGGFGAVFGTPWAGALYAIELPVSGRFSWAHAVPCLVASWCGHATCSLLGADHTAYPAWASLGPGDAAALGRWILAGVVSGLAARAFVASLRGWTQAYGRIPRLGGILPGGVAPVVAASGIVIGCTALLGTDAYLGLGVTGRLPSDPSIVRSFEPGGVTAWSWFWKLLLTTAVLAGGFKGGEVTPLFFIGAAMGQTVATLGGWPVGEFAALGFVAVFAAAGHTPWTCAVLGCELFGPGMLLPGLVAVTVADLVATGCGLHAHRMRSFLVDRWLGPGIPAGGSRRGPGGDG